MKKKTIFIFLCSCTLALILVLFSFKSKGNVQPNECVFNTVFGEVPLDSNFRHAPSNVVISSIDQGLDWLGEAQHPDGGWGAGFHSNQGELDPHKVPADPATTAMVAMAILRTTKEPSNGEFIEPIQKANAYLIGAIEESNSEKLFITEVRGTQIQSKLGDHIDLVLTAQYLTNLLDVLDENSELYQRVYKAVGKSAIMIQNSQDEQGKTKGAGWAGVLQSAFASSALEAAEVKGIEIDKSKLEQSKSYQRSNYDPLTKKVETKDGAGITLYAVSGSARTNAKEARKAKELIDKAIEEGTLEGSEEVNYENLVAAGMLEREALAYDASYQVYQSAKVTAQNKEVLNGFGNNGGEEFMSFLQTGESMIINKDNEWKKWFDSVSANLVNIQNNDGSWNGHHCITSPVFCTATCLLILSINNDIETLVARGE